MFGFIHIAITDVLDITLVAVLVYQLYKLIKGTAAMRIVFSIALLYLVWSLARVLHMEMLGTILGQVLGVGVIALFIVFQPEIRRFLLHFTMRFDTNRKHNIIWRTLFGINKSAAALNVDALVTACQNMSETKTGALIFISRHSSPDVYTETGDIIDAQLNSRLLENIFFKNSPLHDGAVIIENNRIKAARCTLPMTDNPNLPASYGMRHRAAIGASEHSDAWLIIVSEETGRIAVARHGKIKRIENLNELRLFLLDNVNFIFQE
ncbi:MAG: diadenylate cyclase CdaA [Prevotellaceae bacterium]|jgi:uncharacterized protein (TIGR00159 family)|nr:diadenylate cyclase CdaA [Prevotellaceae bacterium]